MGWAGGCAVMADRLKLELSVLRFLMPKSPVLDWKLGDIPLLAIDEDIPDPPMRCCDPAVVVLVWW